MLLSGNALQRRMLSGFLSGTPLPDLVEAYAQIVAQAFKGPLEEVGFVDLTDLVQSEGIDAQINAPSFAPWTSRGRIFGLLMAGTVVSIAPVMGLFLLLQKNVIAGLTSGAIKE
jgi:ABC-type maltose transport system permease subunit